MATKRVSPRKNTRRKAAAVPELTENGALSASAGVDPDVRRQWVAAEACFRAERRGFAAGSELDDWIAAEAAVESRLQQMQLA